MRDAARAALAALTARERVVARLYADGLSRKEVARRLGISPGTVRTHLDAIFRKLRVHTRLALHRLLGGDARPVPARAPFVPVAGGAGDLRSGDGGPARGTAARARRPLP